MGGSILVSSEVGVGSTFTVLLPIEHATEEDVHDKEACKDALRRVVEKKTMQQPQHHILIGTNQDQHTICVHHEHI